MFILVGVLWRKGGLKMSMAGRKLMSCPSIFRQFCRVYPYAADLAFLLLEAQLYRSFLMFTNKQIIEIMLLFLNRYAISNLRSCHDMQDGNPSYSEVINILSQKITCRVSKHKFAVLSRLLGPFDLKKVCDCVTLQIASFRSFLWSFKFPSLGITALLYP